jgi:hypothetical protein
MSDQAKPDDENCGNCRFVRMGPSYYRCCRYPLSVNPMPMMDSATLFPVVKATDWCDTSLGRHPDRRAFVTCDNSERRRRSIPRHQRKRDEP